MKPSNVLQFKPEKQSELTSLFGKLYTPEEVAGFLKVAVSTVYNWAKTGRIKCFTLSEGKRKTTVRFTAGHIEAFLSSQKRG